MSTLLYISISVFVLYLTGIIIYKGIPDSISESYYVLGENKLISSLFTWFCWIVGGTLLPYWLDNGGGILAFLACGALMFVGAAPLFKSHQKDVHFSSAIVCFVSSYLWLLLNNLTAFIISCSILILFTFVKKKLFWREITAFITIFVVLRMCL